MTVTLAFTWNLNCWSIVCDFRTVRSQQLVTEFKKENVRKTSWTLNFNCSFAIATWHWSLCLCTFHAKSYNFIVDYNIQKNENENNFSIVKLQKIYYCWSCSWCSETERDQNSDGCCYVVPSHSRRMILVSV